MLEYLIIQEHHRATTSIIDQIGRYDFYTLKSVTYLLVSMALELQWRPRYFFDQEALLIHVLAVYIFLCLLLYQGSQNQWGSACNLNSATILALCASSRDTIIKLLPHFLPWLQWQCISRNHGFRKSLPHAVDVTIWFPNSGPVWSQGPPSVLLPAVKLPPTILRNVWHGSRRNMSISWYVISFLFSHYYST